MRWSVIAAKRTLDVLDTFSANILAQQFKMCDQNLHRRSHVMDEHLQGPRAQPFAARPEGHECLEHEREANGEDHEDECAERRPRTRSGDEPLARRADREDDSAENAHDRRGQTTARPISTLAMMMKRA